MERPDEVVRPPEFMQQLWFLGVVLFGALILIEYVLLALCSLWIGPMDTLFPIKLALGLGYALLLTQTFSRIKILLDPKKEWNDRIVAFLFLPATLIAVGASVATLPELASFLFHASLPVQLGSSLSVQARAIASIGLLVLLLIPILFLRLIAPELAYTFWIWRRGILKSAWEAIRHARSEGE